MKVLGNSADGGKIVELTRGETDALTAVQEAMENTYKVYRRELADGDVKTAFYLIRGLTQARWMIHDLEDSVAKLKEWLPTDEEADDE